MLHCFASSENSYWRRYGRLFNHCAIWCKHMQYEIIKKLFFHLHFSFCIICLQHSLTIIIILLYVMGWIIHIYVTDATYNRRNSYEYFVSVLYLFFSFLLSIWLIHKFECHNKCYAYEAKYIILCRKTSRYVGGSQGACKWEPF